MPTYKKGDLYVAARVHVVRDGKNEKGEPIKITKEIAPGQMVSETDLTAKEVEGIQKREQSKGALRAPTFEEMQAMDAREESNKAAEAIREAQNEQEELTAEQRAERDELIARQNARNAEELQKLNEKHSKERAAAEDKTQKAAVKAGGAKK